MCVYVINLQCRSHWPTHPPPHTITTSHYLVGNIIGDTLPKDGGNQTGVNLFCVKVLISRVKEEGRGFGTNEVGESLTQHCETENITILCVCVWGGGGEGERGEHIHLVWKDLAQRCQVNDSTTVCRQLPIPFVSEYHTMSYSLGSTVI